MDSQPILDEPSIWGGYLSYPLMVQFKDKVRLLAIVFFAVMVVLPPVLLGLAGLILPPLSTGTPTLKRQLKMACRRGRIWYIARSTQVNPKFGI
jgi:hypothetical protein